MIVGHQIPQDCTVRELSDAPVPYDYIDLHCADDWSARLRFLIAPSHGGGRAVVTFEGCHGTCVGAPNDEALSGHRLAQQGLQAYAFREVTNSDWIAEMEIRNRVHPRHTASIFDGYRHFIVSFHDVTFECIARSFTWTREEVGSR